MDAFDALADPIRRDLLRRLAVGPARVVDLTARYEVTRPAVSRHLRVLTEAGVADAEDRGRERHYRLRPAGLAPVAALLDELASPRDERVSPRIRARALDALDTEVRRTRRERPERRPEPTHREDAG